MEEFLFKRFSQRFKCTNVSYRVPLIVQTHFKFHLDFSPFIFRGITMKAVYKSNTLGVGLQTPSQFTEKELESVNDSSTINFWAILNNDDSFPLAFGPSYIVDDYGKQLQDIDTNNESIPVYYTPKMKVGQFYIFDSFKVPHSGIQLEEHINRISLVLRCVYFKENLIIK